jgi:hypothetical protein
MEDNAERFTGSASNPGKEPSGLGSVDRIPVAENGSHHLLLLPDEKGKDEVLQHRREKHNPGIQQQGYARETKKHSSCIDRMSYKTEWPGCAQLILLPPMLESCQAPDVPADPNSDQAQPGHSDWPGLCQYGKVTQLRVQQPQKTEKDQPDSQT